MITTSVAPLVTTTHHEHTTWSSVLPEADEVFEVITVMGDAIESLDNHGEPWWFVSQAAGTV